MSPALIIQRLFDSRYGASNRLLARWLFLRALGPDLFLGFLFALIPDPWAHRQQRYSSRHRIPGGGRAFVRPGEVLVCAIAVLAFDRQCVADWPFVGSACLRRCCSSSTCGRAECWRFAFVCFLSFVAAAGDFSGYQSDGMLLEAGFIALFFAPPGFRPGWGETHPPSRASLFLLQWEWFRIYFESGVVKLASGDPQWRNWTAMDQYYQNGPLPTWIGYYAQHLPHWFHASTVFVTFAVELGIVWMMFLPRRWRLICFVIVTALQAGIILTANYTFLNYLVLSLGILLLDDGYLVRVLPRRWRGQVRSSGSHCGCAASTASSARSSSLLCRLSTARLRPAAALTLTPRKHFSAWKLALTSVILSWIFYAGTVQLLWMLFPRFPLPTAPVAALDPFRIANRYGLFAVMTRGRYEIEFQGSNDGQNWTPYPFRYKPQDPSKAPGIYAPYQPRFDWNLWFASLGNWRENSIVPSTEERLLSNSHDVLQLFAGNPFADAPPKQVRAVLWQYWFTSSGREAEYRNVVATRADGVVCSRPANRPRRKTAGGGMACSATAAWLGLGIYQSGGFHDRQKESCTAPQVVGESTYGIHLPSRRTV